MAIIPRSQRTKLPPGGRQLPGPSLTRLNTAGVKGRAIAGAGATIQQIGHTAQVINDNAEFENETINIDAQVNSIIARNSADPNLKDPVQFRDVTNNDINKAITVSPKNVNFRNRRRFGTITKRIQVNANTLITKTYLAKSVDLSNAQYTLSSSKLLNEFLDGSITKDAAVKGATVLMADRFNNSIWDAERFVQEERDFNGRIEKLDFVRTYEADPQKAVDTINNSKFLTTEQKTDFLFKMASKIDKAEKKISTHLGSNAKINVSKYDRLSLEGKLVPGFVSDDGLSLETFNTAVDNGTIEGADFRRILKQQRDIFDAGGVGDERVTNRLLAEIDDDFKITDTTIDANKDFNNVQRKELKDDIASRDNDAIRNPIAASYRRDINVAHKATGIFSSSLLSEEIATHLKSSHELYRAFLLKGDEPDVAFAKTQKVVGPVPGSEEISDGGLAKLETELTKFDVAVQKENKTSGGKLARGEGRFESRKNDLAFRRKNLLNDIESMRKQLSTKKFFEELTKNAGTGK